MKVRGRKRPIDILFNLEHSDGLSESTEVDEDQESLLDSEDESDDGDADGDESTLQERLDQLTFVVASKAMARRPNWLSATNVFGTDNDTDLLRAAGVKSFDDPRYEKYSKRLQRLRKIWDEPPTSCLITRVHVFRFQFPLLVPDLPAVQHVGQQVVEFC